MKQILIILLGALYSGISHSQINPNPSASLDAYILNEMNLENFPGVSTIIVKDGEIVWLESYGFADVDNSVPAEDTTVFLLASLSKLFTGTAAMQLYESGLSVLDADINAFMPWPIEIPGFENDSITIRQLMTHTGSIEDGPAMDLYYDYPDPSISLEECIQRYLTVGGTDYNAVTNFYNNPPGTAYNYSNMGTALSGYITQSITGVPFDDYCDNNIFDPLCMEKTAWHFSDFDSSHVARPYSFQNGNYVAYPHYGFADYPDGQLRSNVIDLGNFMIAYLNGGTLGSNSILNNASINEMLSAQVPSLDPTQGLNWYQEELFYSGGSAMLWGHNGGENGVSTDLYIDPINNIGICVLTNGEGDALYICDELYDYALSLNPSSSIIPECMNSNSLDELSNKNKELIKVVDILGRDVEEKPNCVLIYMYSDGSTEKIFKP
ncbi:beta-lactamase family protein [Crocinitomicaceae bacterium]|nr:beta-lactamase family protein [Crocinitomicaceae bacterium]